MRASASFRVLPGGPAHQLLGRRLPPCSLWGSFCPGVMSMVSKSLLATEKFGWRWQLPAGGGGGGAAGVSCMDSFCSQLPWLRSCGPRVGAGAWLAWRPGGAAGWQAEARSGQEGCQAEAQWPAPCAGTDRGDQRPVAAAGRPAIRQGGGRCSQRGSGSVGWRASRFDGSAKAPPQALSRALPGAAASTRHLPCHPGQTAVVAGRAPPLTAIGRARPGPGSWRGAPHTLARSPPPAPAPRVPRSQGPSGRSRARVHKAGPRGAAPERPAQRPPRRQQRVAICVLEPPAPSRAGAQRAAGEDDPLHPLTESRRQDPAGEILHPHGGQRQAEARV
jgi:hypothetical protein